MLLASYLLTIGLTLGAAMPAPGIDRASAPSSSKALPVVLPPGIEAQPPASKALPAWKEPSASKEPPADRRRSVVSFRWENDVVAGTDDNYTNGISLTFSRDGRGPLGGIWGWFGPAEGRFVSSYEVGQMMYTPRDIRRPVPDPTDRPYAALLYVALSTEYVHGNRFDGLNLITGVVGPAALGAQAQKVFHSLTGNPEPQGWAYQLKNEPILNTVYEHRRRYTLVESKSGWGADAVPVVGGMLGNVLIQAEADAQFRIGYNLPDDFGTTLMRGMGNLPFPRSAEDPASPRRFGAYVFAGGGGNLVARNLTLDGNTFRDGPRVPKKPAFGAAEVGASIWSRYVQVTFTYVYWGREYESQTRASRYGAATIAIYF